jgi:23S rRNA (cytidine2498-2'-O)-methyltransferase
MTIPKTAYLAPVGLEKLLIKELKNITAVHDRLIITSQELQICYWAQNIWLNPVLVPISSISNASEHLRALQRNWWPYAFDNFRRIKLIQEKLPFVSGKALDFLGPLPSALLGSFTLLDKNTLLMASTCSSVMPNGEYNFNEDKINPPSRAYLKLWELFTRFNFRPQKTDICIELGASPGGWTWVLAQLAQQVIAFDRSELDPRIMALQQVNFKKQDAFSVNLADYAEASWVFSDIICYPEKLYEFVSSLLQKYPEKKYIFTIKFQGDDNAPIISRFARLPGQLVHLSNNKHELTWFKI